MQEQRLESLEPQDDKTHHNESKNRENVVGRVSEERPPCQSDGLWREERCVFVRSRELLICAGRCLFYLPCKDATQADDDEDVEDG